MTKHKHLTLSDRNDIQLGLERSETFKAIGQSILKDPTTVSKEVKRNRQVRESTCDNLPCTLLDKAPFVCNGCPKRRQNCGYKKIFYLAKQAQKQYEQTLAEGICEQSQISKIERGHFIPSADLLFKLSQRLEVPLDYFLMNKLKLNLTSLISSNYLLAY